jgi:hypothetical protein
MILEAFVLNNFRLNANFFQGGEGELFALSYMYYFSSKKEGGFL